MFLHLGLNKLKLVHILFFTWSNLCSKLCCTVTAAKQDDGVGTRRWRPCCVISSRLAVIVFDKDGDCEGLLFVDVFVEFDKH